MTIEDKTRHGKIKCYINGKAVKISTLSLGKIDKYKYLTGEEMLSSAQIRVIQQTKFTFPDHGKDLEKKKNEDAPLKKLKLKRIKDRAEKKS